MTDKDIEAFISHTNSFIDMPNMLYGSVWVSHAVEIAKELLKLREKYEQLEYDFMDKYEN